MTSYPIAIGETNTYFSFNLFDFIENITEEGTMLKTTDNSFDPYDYHVSKC